MAAIIAQMTLAARRRKEKGKGYLSGDKSNYILKPFDPAFEAKKHNLFRLKRQHYEYKREIKIKAKGKFVTFFGGQFSILFIVEFAEDMKRKDLEFYYFMRYGKIPLRFTNPEAVVESENCEFKNRTGIKVLKAIIGGLALLFFTALFLIMFISVLKVDPDFVHQGSSNSSNLTVQS